MSAPIAGKDISSMAFCLLLCCWTAVGTGW